MKRVKLISDEEILFDNGDYITFYHSQDCCENVFADFNALKDTTFEDICIESINIEFCANNGIKINGHFVPCYNIQNGYYSSDLTLFVCENGETKKIDISECTEWHTDEEDIYY